MQAQEGAVAVAMDQAVADTEMMTTEAALLPVLLPIGGGEAMVDAADAVRSDEMRGLLAAIRRLASIVEEETTASDDGEPSARKKTRRGSRGGRGRKKKTAVAAASASENGDEPAAEAVDEPPADPEETEASGGDEFGYVPMSEWLDDLERR